MDTLSPIERSRRMALVRSKGTKPEMLVRRLVHSLGFRYRLHVAQLPGKPDLVFRRLRKVIFVHGCFWHRHQCKSGQRLPKSRLEFWKAKLLQNQKRDRRNRRLLRKAGWKALIIWECQIAGKSLPGRIQRFLAPD